MRTKRVSHTADYAADAVPGPSAQLGGARSTVHVPMLKDDVLIGTIFIYRQEVRPFADKQIALVQRGTDGDNQTAPRSDPNGHSTADYGRLHSHQPNQG